jgi:hypothetical protein
VYEPVEDGVGKGVVSDRIVPVLEGELTGDQGGSSTVAVLEDLQEVPPLAVVERSQAVVVQDQQVRLGKLFEEFGIASVRPAEGQLPSSRENA